MAVNGYLKKQKAERQVCLDIGEEMGMQKMWDYVQLCLRDPDIMGKDTFGRDRINRLYEGLKKKADKYHVCFTDDKEADYWQEELDFRLKEIWDKDLQPFYERYPYLKQFGYKKARKGWK